MTTPDALTCKMVGDQTDLFTGGRRWIVILLSLPCSGESSDLYAHVAARHPVRHGGFAPALSDQEVITIDICGEYFKDGCDKDLYGYFSAPYRHFFPHLPERTLFVGQAANLWQVKAALQQHLVQPQRPNR